MKPSKKLRASNFEASILRIGDWELKSKLKGDIVAKFYYSNSKMVWETIQEGLKSKMEIKCSDICALKITCPKNLPGMLDIMVSAEPRFFRETKTLPYRKTRWVLTTDFTGGQARSHSRHVLQCDPGIIDKHIENLLSIDHRLYLLTQENNINQNSPCLGTCCSVPGIPSSPSNENSYHSDDDNLFGTAPTGQSMPTATKTVGLNDTGALQGVHFHSSGQTLPQNQPSNGDISPETMALEQIHDNLLSDNEVVNVEQQDLMSTVNSLSCLIGQAAAVAPPPPPHAEPAQVINVAPSESSSAGNQFSPWM
ncbi:hypothetical protein VPH35_092942 [Triticum aestivum]